MAFQTDNVNIRPISGSADGRPETPRTRPRVVALAYDQLGLFEFGIAAEIFGLPRPEFGDDWYDFAVAAVEKGPLQALGGVSIQIHGGMELLSEADTIVIPSWKNPNEKPPQALVDALRSAKARGARLVSICAGAFVLAHAGLLDGLRATTHWRHAATLAARFPEIHVEADVLYVDEGKILTSAGSAAGIDLCLHIVRRDFGASIANQVARRLVMSPHRDGGQAQFVDQPVPPLHEKSRLGPLLQEISLSPEKDHSISSLATMAGMSERTFTRRFTSATGLSPGDWIVNERLRKARDLLETTSAGIEDVAIQSGFGSAEALRHHFRKRLGSTPARYRQQFGREDNLRDKSP